MFFVSSPFAIRCDEMKETAAMNAKRTAANKVIDGLATTSFNCDCLNHSLSNDEYSNPVAVARNEKSHPKEKKNILKRIHAS